MQKAIAASVKDYQTRQRPIQPLASSWIAAPRLQGASCRQPSRETTAWRHNFGPDLPIKKRHW